MQVLGMAMDSGHVAQLIPCRTNALVLQLLGVLAANQSSLEVLIQWREQRPSFVLQLGTSLLGHSSSYGISEACLGLHYRPVLLLHSATHVDPKSMPQHVCCPFSSESQLPRELYLEKHHRPHFTDEKLKQLKQCKSAGPILPH